MEEGIAKVLEQKLVRKSPYRLPKLTNFAPPGRGASPPPPECFNKSWSGNPTTPALGHCAIKCSLVMFALFSKVCLRSVFCIVNPDGMAFAILRTFLVLQLLFLNKLLVFSLFKKIATLSHSKYLIKFKSICSKHFYSSKKIILGMVVKQHLQI